MWMFRRGAEVSSRGVDVATTAVLFQELAANFAGRDDEWTALARLRGRQAGFCSYISETARSFEAALCLSNT
jgi:hypothetical protein